MTPPAPDPGLWETFVLYVTMIAAWVAGEAGRAGVAGAAGGLVRWLMSETRRVRGGIISVTTGAVMAHYLTPLMLAILEKWLGEIKGNAWYSAAFAAGLVGMSLAKLLVAYMERKGRNLEGDGDA